MGSVGGARKVLKSTYKIGIVTKTRAEFKPDWTSFWWMDVFCQKACTHFIFQRQNSPFFKKHFLWWCRIHRCVDRDFILNCEPLYSFRIKLKPCGRETECMHQIFIYLHL